MSDDREALCSDCYRTILLEHETAYELESGDERKTVCHYCIDNYTKVTRH